MLTLLQNVECYSPQHIGKKDILIACDKIFHIQPTGSITNNKLITRVIPCDGLTAFPGLMDQHVHIIGGGGEEGFASRISEIQFQDIIMAGVTTVVGVLGFDSYTRSMENLLAKSRGLEEQGITTFIYTGSYAIPTVSLTKNITSDIVLIDKIIGTGEIAISDNRSTQPTLNDLLKLSADTYIGGLLSGKAGVVHIHVGDNESGLDPLNELLSKSELPLTQFVPTHINRNPNLFNHGLTYCKKGGRIDLTAGESIGVPVPDAIERLLKDGADISNVTVTSDANGSAPNNQVSKIQTLYDDIISCIIGKNISPDIAFGLVTENVAKFLKLYPKKGTLKDGSDADILITDKNYKIQKLFSKGKQLIDDGKVI